MNRGMQIVCIDADPLRLAVTGNVFEQAGFRVRSESGTERGIEAIKQVSADLVLIQREISEGTEWVNFAASRAGLRVMEYAEEAEMGLNERLCGEEGARRMWHPEVLVALATLLFGPAQAPDLHDSGIALAAA